MKKLALIATLLTLVITILRFEVVSASLFFEFTSFVKAKYLATLEATSDLYNTHFDQATTIENLIQENRTLRAKEATLDAFANEVVALSRLKKYPNPPEFDVKTVRALSYASLPDMQKIIIDYRDLGQNEVKGLIYNNLAAGIVVESRGTNALALLNGDTKCTYSVFIGKNEAPGIAMGKSEDEMVVRYIPAWMSVEVGDQVMTSGLDGIFFAGVEVGKVIAVNRLNAYIEAVVRPAYNSFKPDYFYLVELKTKEQDATNE